MPAEPDRATAPGRCVVEDGWPVGRAPPPAADQVGRRVRGAGTCSAPRNPPTAAAAAAGSKELACAAGTPGR